MKGVLVIAIAVLPAFAFAECFLGAFANYPQAIPRVMTFFIDKDMGQYTTDRWQSPQNYDLEMPNCELTPSINLKWSSDILRSYSSYLILMGGLAGKIEKGPVTESRPIAINSVRQLDQSANPKLISECLSKFQVRYYDRMLYVNRTSDCPFYSDLQRREP